LIIDDKVVKWFFSAIKNKNKQSKKKV